MVLFLRQILLRGREEMGYLRGREEMQRSGEQGMRGARGGLVVDSGQPYRSYDAVLLLFLMF